VKALLDDIVAELRRLGREEVVGRLQPPLDESIVVGRLHEVEVEPTREVVDLFGWRNGTHASTGMLLDDLHFFPGFYFLSLAEAVISYRRFRDDERWDRSWFPLFANGGGDFYAAVCRPGELTSPIVGFLLGQPEHPVEYETLTAMVNTLLAAFREGVFFVEGGALEVDDARYAMLARRHNPNVALWRAGL
jgi:hypothetical protein